MTTQLFPLGTTDVSPGAARLLRLEGIEARALLDRHSAGDFGNVPPETAQENRDGLGAAGAIISVYDLACGTVWIITAPDRCRTRIVRMTAIPAPDDF